VFYIIRKQAAKGDFCLVLAKYIQYESFRVFAEVVFKIVETMRLCKKQRKKGEKTKYKELT
jgi:hypothetical protein